MKKKIIISLCAGAMTMLSSPALAQNQMIKGTVVDETGEPIIGATVKVAGKSGTGAGTITDIDGNYSISVPKGGKVVITYIGYLPLTTAPGGKVALQEDRQSLEEVVVVGYGAQKMKNVTGAIETINPKEIQDLSVGSLGDALAGQFNGVSVSQAGGRPGDTPSLQIRQSSVNTSVTPDASRGGDANPSPLYVIDGFISTEDAFNNLDVSEVESISVLKDASAAIYGARAAYGVILVKTKQGSVNAPKISYSGQLGWTDALYTPKMLSSYDYARVYNTMRAANTSTQDNIEMRTQLFQLDEMEAIRGLNYDLLKQNWSAALTHRHNINLNGGTDKATYFASVSYFNQEGNIGRLDYDRWNYRAGVNGKIGKYVKTTIQVSGDYGTRVTANAPSGGGNNYDYRWNATHLPFVPTMVNGYPIIYSGMENVVQTSERNLYNYDAVQNSSDNVKTRSSNMNINGALEFDLGWIKPLKGLTAKFSYSKTISNSKVNTISTDIAVYRLLQRTGSGNHLYTTVDGVDPIYDSSTLGIQRITDADGGYLRRSMDESERYQMNFTLQYARQFGKHDVSALFSVEKSESEGENLWGNITDLIPYQDGQSSSGAGDQTTAFGRSESAMLSYIGRFNYAYAGKYLFEFLMRTDASTKFHPDNYWGYFPSISAGWVVSEEKWFKEKVSWMDFLKIRASWGMMGRDNIKAWLWAQLYNREPDKGAIFGTNGQTSNVGYGLTMPKAGVNPDVHWDTTYKTNIGVDMRFLDGRLSAGINYYYDRGRDLFATRTGTSEYPTTVGTQATPENYGQVDSWGWELSLGWRDKIGKDITYWAKINTGYSDNKVLATNFPAVPEYDDVVYGQRADRGVWGLKCIGMFRSYQQIEEYFDKYHITDYLGKTKADVHPGMLIYEDVRGTNNGDGTYGPADGKIDKNDYIRLSEHSSNPYGFTLNFGGSWKSLSLTAQLAASWGAKTLVSTDFRKAGNDNYGTYEYVNLPSAFSDMFCYEDIYDASGNLIVAANRTAMFPNMNSSYASINTQNSSFWLMSAAQVSLRNITLAWAMPSKWIKSIGLSSVRWNVTVQNAINFINNYPDKSWASYAGGYATYPNLRKVTVGVNVSF
ncbi:TonB-dependent receptor [Prevotella sp. PINT]|jgi:TonB-linked outer membrane protein, SusC/RagA family/TonB-dependent outer membrane receptor, SusC/RagA subfamily, signature region|uniref:SusC/RagA family TonB-linked outer membrane protein n=1 Tax=Palleniella intestinalis TaxID=2736291 RepID=UPI001557E9D8|nr:TonB-dependent receptor [Palleniella intestinalis]NPD81980.1 TonB-dependent receptor [Palleniella intestinalis]